jgi:hypothetical protein
MARIRRKIFSYRVRFTGRKPFYCYSPCVAGSDSIVLIIAEIAISRSQSNLSGYQRRSVAFQCHVYVVRSAYTAVVIPDFGEREICHCELIYDHSAIAHIVLLNIIMLRFSGFRYREIVDKIYGDSRYCYAPWVGSFVQLVLVIADLSVSRSSDSGCSQCISAILQCYGNACATICPIVVNPSFVEYESCRYKFVYTYAAFRSAREFSPCYVYRAGSLMHCIEAFVSCA